MSDSIAESVEASDEAELLAWYEAVLAPRPPRPGSAAWDPDLKLGIALMRSTYSARREAAA